MTKVVKNTANHTQGKLKWLFPSEPDPVKIAELVKSINVRSVIARLLIQRGIDTFDKAKAFFRPELQALHDPFLMKNMEQAVDRLTQAIEKEEKILIYGDYDVDGTTSVSLVYSFLKHLTSHLNFYIPDRYKEGYGVSMAGIEHAIEEGYSLIITLDCGIRAVDKVAFAKENGIDVIICDHHNPDTVLPDAVAVLDPKQTDCPYPYKELSGCGVGFKLLQAYCLKNNLDDTMLYDFLDFLVVSIAADIVPITGENRILASHGLRLINENNRPGFQALKHVSGLEKGLTISNVVFGYAPRINAAGRIRHAKDAVHLMLAETREEAMELVGGVNESNDDRKEFDKQVKEEALEMIESDPSLQSAKTTVLFKSDWHKGVVGISASRCIEQYYRPTIILTESYGKAVGSARSVEGFDIYEALMKCEDLLEQFGGHKYAAGMTLEKENVPAFRARFEEVVAATITDDQLIPKLRIDLEVTLDQLNMKFYEIIRQMAPFGPGNMTPVFMLRGVHDYRGRSRIVGETKEHLKVAVGQNGFSESIDGIAFGMADQLELIQSGKPFDVAFTLELNEWNGETNLQMMVRGIRSSE